MTDWPKPRQQQGIRNFPYKFRIDEDYTYQTDWVLEEDYLSEWLEISKEGLITVKANKNGYAWDGCTPKWSVLHLFIIGTPDGHVNYKTMKPYTYYASLIHDALYQYLDTVPVPKEDIDLLFFKMLGNFKLRRYYYYMAKWFGGRGVVQKGLQAKL